MGSGEHRRFFKMLYKNPSRQSLVREKTMRAISQNDPPTFYSLIVSNPTRLAQQVPLKRAVVGDDSKGASPSPCNPILKSPRSHFGSSSQAMSRSRSPERRLSSASSACQGFSYTSWCNRFVQFFRGRQLHAEGVCFEIDARDFGELGSNETVPLPEDVSLELTRGIDPSTFTYFASGKKHVFTDRSFIFRPVTPEFQVFQKRFESR